MKAIILLHGFATNPDDFHNIITDLEKLYDKIILFTCPGHFGSKTLKGFDVDKTFNALLDIYDQTKIEYDEIDIMGFSMGGALGTYLQAVRPVNKLVLLAPANKYFRFDLLIQKINFYLHNLRDLSLNHDNEEVKDEIENKIKAVHQNSKRAINMTFKTLLPAYTIKNLWIFSQIIKKCNQSFKAITVPTMIIWGKLDQLVPYRGILDDYNKCINTNKKLVILDDMSHLMLNSTNISDLKKEIISFLS